MRWYYTTSTTPAGLTSSQAAGAIKGGANDVTIGLNDCGLPTNAWVANSYLGSTTRRAFGIAHVSETSQPRATMSPILDACSTIERTLGRGDYAGMNVLYP